MPVAHDGAFRPLVTTDRLRAFFAPRSIAVVGASDSSGWARFVVASNLAAGFCGPLIPVHPRHATVFGRPAARSLRDLDEPVDLAFIMAPVHAVESVLDDAGGAGVRNAIVLASGYREAGEPGRALEESMISRAAAHGITVLGPNCLGFLNAHARVAPFALTVPRPLRAGPVGIALQSGALASVVLAFARGHAIGVSTLATMGNEAMIGATDVIEYLVEDDATRVICLFLEEISDPARFARAAERADRAGKPIVALKAGSSPAGRQAALAHTGAVAGDDAVVSAALRQLNVIRVASLEELLCTGGLLGYDRWPKGRRMGVVSTSGGACDLIADRAAAEAIEMPEYAPETVSAITPLVPPFAAVRNPLDVTGYFLANQRTSALTPADHVLNAALADPGLDFVLYTGLTLPDAKPPDERLAAMLTERAAWLSDRIASAPIPVIAVGHTCVDVSAYARELLTRNGIHMLAGIDLGMTALGHALRWLENRGRPRPARPWGALARGRSAKQTAPGQPWSQASARGWLARSGVPVVPRRGGPRAEHRGRGSRRLRARQRGGPCRSWRPDRRRSGQPDAGRWRGADRGHHGGPHVRPGARGRARGRLGGGAQGHQPAGTAGGPGRGAADARRAARQPAAARRAREPARRPGSAGRRDQRARRGGHRAEWHAARPGGQPAMGRRRPGRSARRARHHRTGDDLRRAVACPPAGDRRGWYDRARFFP